MVRFGIVGFGLHAVKRLMPGFAQAKRCRVTALSRRDLQQAKESARQFGIEHAFASAANLCASPGVDAVFVSSPDGLHRDDVLEAVRHGKPVLCEKPMAMNPQQALEMVQAACAAKVLLGVAHVMRFEESVKFFREHVAAGSIGRPVVARADFFAPMLSSARKWINDANLAAGGPLADLGVHCIDALRFIVGQEVRSVSALAHYDSHWVVEASATAMLQFETGMLGTVSVSARTPYQTYLEVAGETGVLSSVNALNVEHPPTVELRRGFDVIERREVSNAQAYAAQVDAFAAAIEEGREFDIPGEEGLRNQLVLDASFRSVKSGKMEVV
ncbi:MAG: Gfo/Idh/MocA family oxidoreductase [Candidatus Korobacteraceae bacterium]|jgi:predicted dehydrogenase